MAESAPSPAFFQEGAPAHAVTQASMSFPHFTELVRELSKAVVNISVEADVEDQELENQSKNFPFFKRDPERQLFSLGSGFIVSPDGYILTNNHVIERAKRVVVRLLDDRTDYEAKIIGRDVKTDLAVIKIESKVPLASVFLGDSDSVEVGEWVIAIGNQFQLGQTVTAGIVSAIARKVPSREATPYDSFIQTDASINPGSSGGPLFNTRGQVIGINTAIFSPGRGQPGVSGFNIGIGFAIPINLVKLIVPQLKERGRVTRGMLGVVIQPVDKDVAQAMELDRQEGALVADVVTDSPASRAGFRRKDIVVKFNDKPVRDHDNLPLLVANTTIGSKAVIEVLRGGKIEKLTATIEELKESAPPDTEITKPQSNILGLVLQPMSAELAKILGQEQPSGVVVEAVENNSPAFKAGVQRGDVIEELHNQIITDLASFETAMKTLKPDHAEMMLVRRKEGTRWLLIKLPAKAATQVEKGQAKSE